MSNPNFVPNWSTNDIYRDTDQERCLTDDLDAIEEALEGKAATEHTHSEYASSTHTHTEYASSTHEHTGYAPSTHEHDGYASSNHTHTEYAPNEHTHTGYASEDHTHTGFAAENHTHTEYASVSHEHTGYAQSDHTHTASDVGAIAKALQFTNDSGGVEFSFGTDSGKNILTEINSWGVGFHTAYAVGSTEGNPTTDSYRYLVHKTNTNIGWVLAFNGLGDVYSNYVHAGTWGGWRKLYTTNDTVANALWTGARYMNAGHTITPSKKLSECRNGWMLEWSDYDSDTSTPNNYNIVHTPIYKRNVAGDWSGQNMMVFVPNYVSDDGATTAYCIKQLLVHDDKIIGHALNSTGTTSIDVVLRAVYEF